MSAKELKAIADVGRPITLGYSGDELKQFVNDEKMRMDKEKELERQRKEAVAEMGDHVSHLLSCRPNIRSYLHGGKGRPL